MQTRPKLTGVSFGRMGIYERGLFMLAQILQVENLIFYILTAEVFLLLLLQLRTNRLLKRSLKVRTQKKENLKQMKEEVKAGKSEIPVVKFEKQKDNAADTKKTVKDDRYDAKEMAVLQEMMTEFFG